MVPEGQPRLHTLKCRSTNQAAAISLGARTAKKKKKVLSKVQLNSVLTADILRVYLRQNLVKRQCAVWSRDANRL